MGILSDLVAIFTGEKPLIDPTPSYKPPRESVEEEIKRLAAERDIEASRRYMENLAAEYRSRNNIY